MKFTFTLYDFDCDNQITKEDVRLVMSYMPYEVFASAPSGSVTSKGVILFEERQEAASINFSTRVADLKEIEEFVEKIF